MVIFDTAFLLFLVQDTVSVPVNPQTKEPIEDCKTKIDHLVKSLQKDREKIVVPTPVLAEVMVRADAAGPEYIAKITKSSAFRVESFDAKAAIEVGLMTGAAKKAGDKREGSTDPWSKVKFDRQIIGIAVANQISTIYAHDENLRKLAEKKGITVIGLHEIEAPPIDPQLSLGLGIVESSEILEEGSPKE